MHIGPSPIAIKALFYLVGRRALEFKTDRNEMGLIISENVLKMAVFSFLYLKKFKISKIYVRFEIFQKYTPVALP